ncbi:MAG TPA: hypothetical protein VK826_16080 [Bacteroidia bacterium]|nr:hypothetical protein [Bacteroidia bacterium]
MKKSTLFIAALALGATTAFAQDLTSKKGEPILPEAGDYAIGVEASPFLNYFGNLFNGTQNNSFGGWNFTNGNMMITGKMFATETMAYRGMLRIGFGSTKVTTNVSDDLTAGEFKTDELKMSGNYIGLGGGLEWRRGKGRLQGYWGGMIMFGIGSNKDTYTYGNDITNTNNFPTTTDFSSYTGYPNQPVPGTRITEWKSGSQMDFGLRGFVGAEFFVLPKLSIGGEFGWGLMFSSMGASSTSTEFWDGVAGAKDEQTTEGGKWSMFGVDTDNNAFGLAPAAVLIHFHF